MKSYLDLIPLYAQTHKKQNRMSVLCIILSVFLVTSIFGMADMYIRSQLIQTKRDDGNWHISIKNISDEEAALIAARPEVKSVFCYGVLNYRLDEGYTLGGKDAVICGSEEGYLTEIWSDTISEGAFPQNPDEILVSSNVKEELGIDVGSQIAIRDASGAEYPYTISGFVPNLSMVLRKDIYGIFMSTDTFRAFYPGVENGEPDDYNSCFFVQFHNHRNMRRTINDIKEKFHLSDSQVGEQAMLLGLLGQSDQGSQFFMFIYSAAAFLSALVLLAGILMIASSLNSNIAGRTQFFGMLRCIGATPKQIIRLVHREALCLCRFAIPVSIAAGTVVIWVLCALLRFLSPKYFSAMPVLAVSLPSIAAGIVIGILTVLLAARAPAKRASKASPLAAVSGNGEHLSLADRTRPHKSLHKNSSISSAIMAVTSAHAHTAPHKKGSLTARCAAKRTGYSFPFHRLLTHKVDTALGIRHALESPKNFLLTVSSFALSIILFLSFSTTIDFMRHAVTALKPWSPDLSIVAPDNTCALEHSLLDALQDSPAVKRVYGRMFAYDLPVNINGKDSTAMLISYDETQFKWAHKYLIEGSIKDVENETGTGLIVSAPQYNNHTGIQTGDTVSLTAGGIPGEIQISGMVSECPFNTEKGDIILCSEDTFRRLTGEERYTIIDIQLSRKATDSDVDAIRALTGEDCTFSDLRMDKESILGANYSFKLFIYGFLFLIAMVTICNIVNCIAMSVEARIRHYGCLRAIGLSDRQLTRMIIAQTLTYALTGSVIGSVLGLIANHFLFEWLVAFRWNEPWSVPAAELCVILCISALSVVLSVWGPVKKLHEMSIVDTISGY